jgi:hypothetical protein
MEQLMVSFQRWAGSADEDFNFFLVGGKNYSWQLLQITEQLKFPTLWKRYPTFLVRNLFQRVGNLFVVTLYCSYVRERVGNLL